MSSAYLLTWNPRRWEWHDLDDDVAAVRNGRRAGEDRWSTGVTRSIRPGDRLFLLRQGVEPRGVIASGWATSECIVDDHWDEERAEQGDTANYVKIKFDTLLHPDLEGPLGGAALTLGALSRVNWRTMSSGIRIDPDAARELEERWAAHVQSLRTGRRLAANGARRGVPQPLAPGSPATDGMTLTWDDGWVESFPEAEFAEECVDRPRRLLLYKWGAAPTPVDYLLTVQGTTAVLDYGGKFQAVNESEERSWDPGRLRITFADESRTVVEKFEWADEGKQRYREIDVECSWAAPGNSPIEPFAVPDGEDQRQRAIGEQVLRPGQLRFREMLRDAYSARCAITGLEVWAALEAAHIMPYRGPDYDHVQNGLLIRADLHRLFDRLLLGIDPKRGTVVLAPELRRDSSYAPLDGRKLREPRRADQRPAREALEDHWRRFRAARQ